MDALWRLQRAHGLTHWLAQPQQEQVMLAGTGLGALVAQYLGRAPTAAELHSCVCAVGGRLAPQPQDALQLLPRSGSGSGPLCLGDWDAAPGAEQDGARRPAGAVLAAGGASSACHAGGDAGGDAAPAAGSQSWKDQQHPASVSAPCRQASAFRGSVHAAAEPVRVPCVVGQHWHTGAVRGCARPAQARCSGS